MVSTESEEAKAAQALDAGARGYLPKPFTSDDLTNIIQKTLEKSG
jgi:DNA-binding NarL/FixJ family response regulator